MTRVMIAMGLCLAMGTAAGNDKPPPAPNTTTPEKAGTNESLQNGGDTRPWAVGVAVADQQKALQLFHGGNVQLNDGLFAKAADKYREALKPWDHPAIHYNLALAQMNLDQPIDAYNNLQSAVKFGEPPLQSKDKFDHATDYLKLLEKE